MKIVVIQGPNLNMLGVREQQVYGPMRLEQIHAQMKEVATQNGLEIEFYQSNLEGEIVDRIQECYGDADGIIHKVVIQNAFTDAVLLSWCLGHVLLEPTVEAQDFAIESNKAGFFGRGADSVRRTRGRSEVVHGTL